MPADADPPIVILTAPVPCVIAWAAAVLATLAHGTVAWYSYDTWRSAGNPAKARR